MSGPYEQRISQLLRKLTVTSDPLIVERLAAEMLSERPSELLAEFISALGRKSQDERARIVYTGAVRLGLGGQQLPQRVREEVYSLLAARGEAALVRFLLPVTPSRPNGESEGMRDPVVDEMTLGMKKWKARSLDRDLLARLSRVGDPAVIRIWLDNPRLLEADVVSLAARRPASAKVLLMVGMHRKWSLRPAVQEALARNPYSPVHLAAAYLPFLPGRILRLVRGDASLHSVVRESARDILGLRTRKEEL